MKDNKKHEREKLSKRVSIKKKRRLTQRQKAFAKLLPVSTSATQAAVDAGYSRETATAIASQNLTKLNVINEVARVERNLKEYLNAKGMDDENIAERIIHHIDYNSQEVVRVVGEGQNAREVVEMRDAKTAATMLTNVVKFKGASLENTTQSIINDVNADTAWLAIKSLVRKLSVEQVKELRDSCDAMLESNNKIVSQA